MGEGECAGEVVPYVEVELAAAERELFESQVLLDEGQADGASTRAFSAMVAAGSERTSVRRPNFCNTRSTRETSDALTHPSRCDTSAANSMPAPTASPCNQVE